MVPQIHPPMTFEGSGPSPPRRPGQREGAAAERQVLSVPVAGSVAETPRLIEGTELGLEYAPFDEDDGPVDCDCPASCYPAPVAHPSPWVQRCMKFSFLTEATVKVLAPKKRVEHSS